VELAGDVRQRLGVEVLLLLLGVEVRRLGLLSANRTVGDLVGDLIAPVLDQDLE
jgi:hypothetical protein